MSVRWPLRQWNIDANSDRLLLVVGGGLHDRAVALGACVGVAERRWTCCPLRREIAGGNSGR